MSQSENDESWIMFQHQTHKPANNPQPLQELARHFARALSTDNGKHVMTHLRGLTKERSFGPDVPDSALRYMEGQRGLVSYIERLIERGRG